MERRSKSRDDSVYTDWQTWTQSGSNPATVANTGTIRTVIDDSYMVGFAIPGYHKLKREGKLLPSTPWTQATRLGSAEGSVSIAAKTSVNNWTGPGWHMWGDNFLPSFEGVLDGVQADVDLDYFVQAAAARIYSSGWDALTFASELHKVVAMFRKMRKRLLKTIATGRFDKLWLEGRYGWRTLLYDVKDLQKVLSTLDSSRSRFTERVGTSFVKVDEATNPISLTAALIGESATITKTWNVSVRGTVTADIVPPKFQFDGIRTAWELTTFSFVIDWFVNVGQFIESMSFLALATNYTAASGLQIDYTESGYVNPGTVDTVTYYSASASGNYSGTVSGVHRNPALVSRVPQLKVNLDTAKLLDLVALATGRLL